MLDGCKCCGESSTELEQCAWLLGAEFVAIGGGEVDTANSCHPTWFTVSLGLSDACLLVACCSISCVPGFLLRSGRDRVLGDGGLSSRSGPRDLRGVRAEKDLRGSQEYSYEDRGYGRGEMHNGDLRDLRDLRAQEDRTMWSGKGHRGLGDRADYRGSRGSRTDLAREDIRPGGARDVPGSRSGDGRGPGLPPGYGTRTPQHYTPTKQAGSSPAEGPSSKRSTPVNPLLQELAKQAREKLAKAEAVGKPSSSEDCSPGQIPSSSGEVGVKRKRHSPIVWNLDEKSKWHEDDGDDAEDAKSEEQRAEKRHSSHFASGRTLQDRLALDLDEFHQLQKEYELVAAPAVRSPSVSEEEDGEEGRGYGRGEVEEVEGRNGAKRASEDEDLGAPSGLTSRWLEDDVGEGGGEDDAKDDVEEGEAAEQAGPTASDEEKALRELNQRELEDLEAARNDDDGGEVEGRPDLGSDDGEDGGIQPGTPEAAAIRSVNMLEECRSVEEYEKLNKISEGTYGIVFRAREKKTGKIFALKKVKMDGNQGEGFPTTALREVNVLLSLHHPNIVNVTEVVMGRSMDSVYMVMEFMEHDLKTLMKEQRARFSVAEVKCLMLQLLSGVRYLHENWVIHRDLKTSNILYNNKGELKICDFGLARQYADPLKPYTPCVVTLWYRAPELLLGARRYSTALDMWSVGCIMAELLHGEHLMPGEGEVDQLNRIFRLMGTPTKESWPAFGDGKQLPNSTKLKFPPAPCTLRRVLPKTIAYGNGNVLSDVGYKLLLGLLAFDPEKRLTAEQALADDWFTEPPLPKSQHLMPSFNITENGTGHMFRNKTTEASPGAI